MSRDKRTHHRRVQADDFDGRIDVFQLLRRAAPDVNDALTAAASQQIFQEGVYLVLMNDVRWRINEFGVIETDFVVRGKSSVHRREVVVQRLEDRGI